MSKFYKFVCHEQMLYKWHTQCSKWHLEQLILNVFDRPGGFKRYTLFKDLYSVDTFQHYSGVIITLPKHIYLETTHKGYQNLVIPEIVLRKGVHHIKIYYLKCTSKFHFWRACRHEFSLSALPICTVTLQKNKLLQYRDSHHLMQKTRAAVTIKEGVVRSMCVYVYITFNEDSFCEIYNDDILGIMRNYSRTRQEHATTTYGGINLMRVTYQKINNTRV
jgi:hypothetical protein